MGNAILSWSMLIIPWLSLLLMKKEAIKQFMPVALLAAITSVIVYEMGISFKWWIVTWMAFPLQLQPFHIGLFPILTMWIFMFTYRKFWLYMVVELVTNIGFDFLFLGWFLPLRGILHFSTMTPIVAVCVTTLHGSILYVYQAWQDDIFVVSSREGRK